MLIEPYTPKFGREYFDLKGPAQFPMFMATALGVKRTYDDWIQHDKYEQFCKICDKYGLHVEPDVIFQKPRSDENIIGKENVTTTYFVGRKFKKDVQGEVHVLVSKNKEDAIQTKKYAWYGIFINNRCYNKPFVDHMRFGKMLGFPDCCVDFFRRYNNWQLYSHPYEAYKATKGRGSYLCNNFLMDNALFLIHHIPCSYQCETTKALAKKVENAFRKVEPGIVEKTIKLLKKPLLVFGERNFIVFDGTLDSDEIRYKDCEYISNPARPELEFRHMDELRKGDRIKMHDKVQIFKGETLLIEADKKDVWFMIGFE